MDPLTQASLGAAVAACASRKHSLRRALFIGALAGAAPDLDVLIRSNSDPLLSLQYHRHFTHALIAAPLIGLIVGVLIKCLFLPKHWPLGECILFATLGALSHGLLDACTSYGTMLYLPFSHHRESWDIISIIDPLFTLPLLLLLILGFWRTKPILARVACIHCALYLCLGVVQRERAKHYTQLLAEARHHRIEQITVRPSFANLLLWRTIYRTEQDYHVDAVRLAPLQPPQWFKGNTVPIPKLSVLVPPNSQQAKDIERFNHFSQGYLYLVPSSAQTLGDLRYSLLPNSIDPLWGIRYNPSTPDRHVDMLQLRKANPNAFQELWSMLAGSTPNSLN
ncbi:metal-dependent hydrolase [Coraliomargarita akajimensis]|uniref:Membrane-bound metal-dependent hydrolase n=1 Tax=Coraliomargarita akajimensis (strain DSM 45221 / IAM 15411 / JCM 23193 / KCTC 12865 / 04OKA010-24) TaxID=583355 RepID=D5EM85_CORAD|nr:metal-dependent hydrolase [Coraliomargarita akajimensis]ADE55245.1 membrane-bound metal-dependent hydrolase [Coraliomargarita akajimensis DSM 45221]